MACVERVATGGRDQLRSGINPNGHSLLSFLQVYKQKMQLCFQQAERFPASGEGAMFVNIGAASIERQQFFSPVSCDPAFHVEIPQQ